MLNAQGCLTALKPDVRCVCSTGKGYAHERGYLSGGGKPSAMQEGWGEQKARARTVRPSYRSATTSVGLHVQWT